MNILDAQIENGRMVLGDQRTVETDTLYGLVNFGIRPEHLIFEKTGAIHVNAKMAEPLGVNTLLHCDLADTNESFTASLQGVHVLNNAGSAMRFSTQPGKSHLFDIATGLRMPVVRVFRANGSLS
jgi:sn-glycerol 3-phosphate transport system ATP-binding protein